MIDGGIIGGAIPYGIPAGIRVGGGLLGNDIVGSGDKLYKQANVEVANI